VAVGRRRMTRDALRRGAAVPPAFRGAVPAMERRRRAADPLFSHQKTRVFGDLARGNLLSAGLAKEPNGHKESKAEKHPCVRRCKCVNR